MPLHGPAQQVWIFIRESDRWQGRSLYMAILEELKREGCVNAAVLRGMAGVDADGHLHTASLVELSLDLPLVITFVEQPERVARLIPRLDEMVGEGLITIATVEVVKAARRLVGPFPAHLRVTDIMSHDVTTVAPESPLAEIVTAMIDRRLRAVPVVGVDRQVVGIITDGDLLRRGSLALPIHLKQALPPAARLAAIEFLHEQPYRAVDLMTPEPHTLPVTSSLARAAQEFVRYDLKRMPVVDEMGRLLGMVSRGDLLGTIVEGVHPSQDGNAPPPRRTGQVVGEVMITEIPAVARHATLDQVVEQLLGSTARRVVVLGEEEQVVGIITDGDILRRASRRIRPNLLFRLASWLGGGTRADELAVVTRGRLAADVMSSPVVAVQVNTPIAEAIQRLMDERVRRMPVVDGAGRLVGIVGRAGLLQALAHEDPLSR